MKKIIAILLTLSILVGCAATNYKFARGHANDVKNGMTIAEVIAILGIPPTDQDETHVEWRRGNAQTYDGTKNGSVRYQLLNGKVVDVPEGGIFSPAAAEKSRLEREQRQAIADAKWLADQEAKSIAAAASAKQKEDARQASEAKLRDQLEREASAERHSSYTCSDKATCTKAFALAQIFVSNNSDQKIQVATDTIIETYNPTDVGKLGMKIVKTPSRGTTEVISVIPSCKENEFSPLLCSLRRTLAHERFRPFIENALSR
jgi:hypothetical protein